MSDAIHVFAYDAEWASSDAPIGHEPVAAASVGGTLFRIADIGGALMLAGAGRVQGEIRRYAPESLLELDAHARVGERLFSRVGVEVDGAPCWTYVAGPALAPRLAPERRRNRTQETAG